VVRYNWLILSWIRTISMKTHNFLSLFLFIISLNGHSADFAKIQEDLRRLQQEQQQLSEQFRRLGFNDFNGSSSSSKKAAQHDKFIDIPQELRERSLFHLSCDCQGLVQEGHYCGSHALAHAVDIEQTHGVFAVKGSPETIVKDTFKQLNLGDTKLERTLAQNIRRVAQTLNLDNLFIHLNKGEMEVLFKDANELSVIATFRAFDAMRRELYRAKDRTAIKHVFAVHEVPGDDGRPVNHVALFSIIADKDGIYMTLHDNLNTPIKRDSALFAFADKLIKFFIESDRSKIFYEDVALKLASLAERDGYLQELRASKESSQQRKLIENLYNEWLRRTKQATTQAQELNLAALNAPVKSLKDLFLVEPILAKKLILQTYRGMVAVVRAHEKANREHKLECAKKIVDAIKKTAHEQKVFSLQETSDLFDESQNLLTALRSSY
jgi:hypothetical protein